MAVSIVLTGAVFFCPMAMAIDRITLPPVLEEFFSPARNYMFVVSTPDEWKSIKSFGELFRISGEARRLLWRRALPHNYGPRFVNVSDKGEVLLLDEWINVKSSYAVMILDCKNHIVAQYDFDAIQKILDVPPAEIARMAKHGVWIMSPPTLLDAYGENVLVETAGKVIKIRLSDGSLSIR